MSRTRAWRRLGRAAVGLVLLMGAAAAGVWWLNVRGEAPIADPAPAFAASAAQVERGRYLALAGNCAGCHTAPGGAAYAGGVGIATPFGTVYAGNLTPDEATGLGRWSADHFWRALHHGRSRDGRLLTPAFPYTSYTQLQREDSDALYAWLRTLPAVSQPNRQQGLRFPYNTQAALAVWRALYFRAASFEPVPSQSAQWNRGAYLVGGLGHCMACHGPRNALGAPEAARPGEVGGGGLLADQGWYAPALDDSREAGVMRWREDDVVALLRDGRNAHAGVSGPMAEVVYRSTQHLSDADLRAMAGYLRTLPDRAAAAPAPPPAPASPAPEGQMLRGERIYAQQCAWCHGAQGQGQSGAFPPLAGNRALNMAGTRNLVQMLRQGGYLPATAGNPRPHGMPPFGHALEDADIADVLTYVRGSWGNRGAALTLGDVARR
ncbi:cytochrome c [Xenophilus arseniciresistens]|uniref:Cytochrome c n=1 Tax=Xenophilus arseniciresistens TaxID=1283306 RepID=A0AAE3SZ69_9BURK|nr:cytochrome c [Xenophilus arseniciresistens]MDA7414982.1 cytochrome c [Xenophilus arseniciresistens]